MNRLLKYLLVSSLVVITLFNMQCISKQVASTKKNSTASPISLKGTDIYNGLRGQSFNEGWKFYKVIVDCGGYEQTHLNWIRLRQTGRERCDKSGKRQKLLWHRFLSHQLALPQRHLFFGC